MVPRTTSKFVQSLLRGHTRTTIFNTHHPNTLLYGSFRQYSSKVEKPPVEPAPKVEGYLAAVLKTFGSTLSVERITKPSTPGPSEVLLQVDSAGLNSADLSMMSGKHYLRPDLPIIPGFEIAGEVIALGKGVKAVKLGDRVVALRTRGTGGFAQRCIVGEHELHPIPHSISYEMAASLPVAYGSVIHIFERLAKTKEGDTVMVVTAQGGTGLAAVDIAQNVFKCKVIVATQSESNCEVARNLGVLATVKFSDENLPKEIRRLNGGRGVDICIDTVGGHFFDLAMKSIKPGGHMILTGFSSKQAPTLNCERLLREQITISGVWFGGLINDEPDTMEKMIDKIVEWRDAKYCHPKIDLVMPLSKINEAIALCQSKTPPLGKVIITCRDEVKKDEK